MVARMMRPPKGAVRTVLAAATAVCIAGFVGVAFGAIPGAGGKISACYGKIGGGVRVIDAEAGAHCTNLEKPFSFNQQGPKGDPGQKGDAGSPGVKGDKGDKGDPGDSLASFDGLEGLPCTRSGDQGTIALTYAGDGTVTLNCMLPFPPCVGDDWPDTPDAAALLGVVFGDSGPFVKIRDGRACDTADVDWFSFFLSEEDRSATPHDLTVRVDLHVLQGNLDVCLTNHSGTPLACSSLSGRQTDSLTFTVADTTEIDTQEFRIKVYPSSAPGAYQLEVSGDV
jgi:hypothetical protein